MWTWNSYFLQARKSREYSQCSCSWAWTCRLIHQSHSNGMYFPGKWIYQIPRGGADLVHSYLQACNERTGKRNAGLCSASQDRTGVEMSVSIFHWIDRHRHNVRAVKSVGKDIFVLHVYIGVWTNGGISAHYEGETNDCWKRKHGWLGCQILEYELLSFHQACLTSTVL